MDWNKKKFIDRFVQSVSYHGPSLITLVKDEQGDSEDSPVNFLYPKHGEGSVGANYFKHRLQTSGPEGKTSESLKAGDGMHQSCNSSNETHCSSNSQETTEQSHYKDDDFHQKLRRFVASKADLLFCIEGKQKMQRGVDYGVHLNQEVLDLYADTPPLETLMEVPLHVRRTQLFKCLKEGDIVIGRVSCKRPFGIIVTLALLESGCNRDFTDLDIQALCKSSEIDNPQMTREYTDPTDAYVIGDVIRGVIIGVSLEDNRVSISLRHSRLPETHQHLRLGVIDEPDTVFTRLQSNPEGLDYNEYLSKHKGFNNPRNIDTLTDMLGIDTSAPCSLLRSFQRWECPDGNYAESLRKQQSAKWSMETTAKGVEHFKSGNYDAAMKYFEHALQIDGENAEALVARGALCANQDKLTAAIKDFRDALVICPAHRNANKYLAATLVEYGIQQEKEGLLTEAIKSFKGALGLDEKLQSAKEHVEKIQRQIKLMEEKKEKTAVRMEKGLKSRFSHVRELILEEQSQAKKKRKRSDRKKKKKIKSLKKKKKRKTKSKVRHRSKRSSSSSRSSSESSDESESSKADSSDGGEEWIEKQATVQNVQSKEKEQHSNREQHDRHGSQHLKRDSRDGRLGENRVHSGVTPQSNYARRDSEPRRSTSRTECSPVDDDGRNSGSCKLSPRFHRGKGEETVRRRRSSFSQNVKEKYDQREGDSIKRKRVCDERDENFSPGKRVTSERETYKVVTDGVMRSKRMKSPVMASNPALSPLNESFLEKELKRIRAHSDKDSEKQSKSVHYSVSKTGCHGSHIKTVHDNSTELVGNRGSQLYTVEQLSSRQIKGQTAASAFHDTNSKVTDREWDRLRESLTSLGTRDKVSGSLRDNRSSLVSYEDSSDDGNG